jgi:hypothetical protein
MRIRRTFTLAISLAALAATTVAAQTATAQTGKSTGTTLTKDTENPARSAVQGACIMSWTNSAGANQCVLMTVPATKRVVVEHASGNCAAQGTELIHGAFIETTLAGSPQPTIGTYMFLANEGTTVDGHLSVASQSMRAYSDPGSTVKAKAAFSGNPTDSYQTCYFSFSGHLVDVQ